MYMQSIRISVLLFVFLTLLLGVVYPAVVTGIAQGIFPHQAEGSLITGKDGKVLGSELIGQNFSDPKYFWSRLSATSPQPYNAASSSGSNFGVNNQALHDAVKGRADALQKADPDNKSPIPVDLVTASGSGLDPHISLAAANYQISRVAKARGLQYDVVKGLVTNHSQGRFLGVLGEPVVNVLTLNLALDDYTKNNAKQGTP
jgi:K+-transporting ATPase ATPase C chain